MEAVYFITSKTTLIRYNEDDLCWILRRKSLSDIGDDVIQFVGGEDHYPPPWSHLHTIEVNTDIGISLSRHIIVDAQLRLGYYQLLFWIGEHHSLEKLFRHM